MKRPGPLAYLFGNPVSFIGLSLAVVGSFIAAINGAVSYLVPIVLLAIGAYSRTASEKIAKYNAWKTEWDSMNGGPTPPVVSPKAAGGSGARYVLGAVAWIALALLAVSQAGNPDMQAPVALFFLATALLVVVGLVRLMRRRAARPSTAAAGPVAVCLAVPRQSASTAQAFAALPQYCLPLFGNSYQQPV